MLEKVKQNKRKIITITIILLIPILEPLVEIIVRIILNYGRYVGTIASNLEKGICP